MTSLAEVIKIVISLDHNPDSWQDLRSLDFVVNRFFMKLFKTTDINVTSDINLVETCQQYFSFRLPSDILQRRTTKFLDNITNS